MSQQNRVNLKSFFQTGFKPTQPNFSDLIDSIPNIQDDGITADAAKNISLTNGLTIGNSSLDTPGSIRWNGAHFQFRDGAGWSDLGAGGGSQWTSVGPDINLPTGKAGIGLPAATSPTYKFEVNLADTGTVADQVRLGSAAFFLQANAAFLGHTAQANPNTFALSQDSFGRTTLNYATGQKIQFCENNVLKAAITAGVLCIGAPSAPGGSTALLFVNGDAAKTTGGNTWTIISDERLKSDISPFNDSLSQLKKLKPVTYKYNGKAGIPSDKEHVGLIAQEVLKIFPYMIGHIKAKLEESDAKETDLLSLDTSALTYVLVNAVKELDTRLGKLERITKNKAVAE